MWNILGSDARLCDGVTRRDVLRFGGLSAFGLTLPHLLQNRSFAATEEGSGRREMATRRPKTASCCF